MRGQGVRPYLVLPTTESINLRQMFLASFLLNKHVSSPHQIPDMVLSTVTDEETGPERLSKVPKVTRLAQLSKVGPIPCEEAPSLLIFQPPLSFFVHCLASSEHSRILWWLP